MHSVKPLPPPSSLLPSRRCSYNRPNNNNVSVRRSCKSLIPSSQEEETGTSSSHLQFLNVHLYNFIQMFLTDDGRPKDAAVILAWKRAGGKTWVGGEWQFPEETARCVKIIETVLIINENRSQQLVKGMQHNEIKILRQQRFVSGRSPRCWKTTIKWPISLVLHQFALGLCDGLFKCFTLCSMSFRLFSF